MSAQLIRLPHTSQRRPKIVIEYGSGFIEAVYADGVECEVQILDHDNKEWEHNVRVHPIEDLDKYAGDGYRNV